MREQRSIDGVDGRRVGKRSKGKRVFEESPAQMLGNQRHEAVVGGKLVEDIVGDKKHLLFKIMDIRVEPVIGEVSEDVLSQCKKIMSAVE